MAARLASPDFGVWHRDDMMLFNTASRTATGIPMGSEGVIFTAFHNRRVRVSVVAETGDVYGLELNGQHRSVLLGNLGMTDKEWGTRPIREISPVYVRAEKVFAGWADTPGLGRELSWFVNRLAGSR